MDSHFLLATFVQYNVCEIHRCFYIYHIAYFYCHIEFRCINILQLTYSTVDGHLSYCHS